MHATRQFRSRALGRLPTLDLAHAYRPRAVVAPTCVMSTGAALASAEFEQRTPLASKQDKSWQLTIG
jgi:hypothetical protein